MGKAWMPLYIGDYLGDTTHLTQGEHGAYLLFIMHYWLRGPIPTDKKQCYCIAHALDIQSRYNADAVLKHFFVKDGEVYRHSRIDKELTKADESYKRRRGAASARWSKMQSNSNGDALHMQSQSQSHIKPNPPLPPLPPKGLTVRDRRKLNEEIWRLMDKNADMPFDEALKVACAELLLPYEIAKTICSEAGLETT